MLEFRQDDTTTELILTLTENVSITNPFYLFVFTHVTTKEVISFLKSWEDDESGYSVRYNQFMIQPTEDFEDASPGEWHYKIYEQASDTNLDPSLSGAVLEFGKLMLDRSTDFAYEKYDTPTTFKSYNG